jgi:hypothetical protein
MNVDLTHRFYGGCMDKYQYIYLFWGVMRTNVGLIHCFCRQYADKCQHIRLFEGDILNPSA